MTNPSLLALATDSAWDSLEDPLTVADYRILANLQHQIAAAIVRAEPEELVFECYGAGYAWLRPEKAE